MSICPICEVGTLVEKFEDMLYYSVCPFCGSETANAEQVRRNKELFQERMEVALASPRRTIPNGLTREEKREMILSFGNKQEE